MKIKQIENELNRKLQEAIPGAGWGEYENTSCGDKIIMGRHVTVSIPSHRFDKPVSKECIEFVRELFNEYFDDVLDVVVKNERISSGCGNACWREIILVLEKIK